MELICLNIITRFNRELWGWGEDRSSRTCKAAQGREKGRLGAPRGGGFSACPPGVQVDGRWCPQRSGDGLAGHCYAVLWR